MKIFITFLFLTVSAWGAVISSNAVTGLWSATGSWVGGVVPGNGDTVSIVDGAVITVNDARIVGTSPASGNTVLNTNTSGQLIIASGGSLKVRGDAIYNSAGTTSAVIVQGGGIWEFDSSLAASPSTTHYVFGQSTHFGLRAFQGSGTSGSRAIVRSNAGGGAGQFTVRGFTRGGGLTSTYTDFLRIGDASNVGWEVFYDTTNSYGTWNSTHNTFTSCGSVAFTNPIPTNEIFIHDNNVHTLSLGTAVFGTIFNNNTGPGTGTLDVSGNVFDIPASLTWQDGGFTFSGNYFNAAMATSGSNACATRTGDFYRFTFSQLASYMVVDCTMTDPYIFVDADQYNNKPIKLNGLLQSDLKGVVNGQGGSGAGPDSGELWWQPITPPGSPLTWGMYNSIMLPDATGQSPQEGGSIGVSNQLIKAEHNVWFGGRGTGGIYGFIDVGEGGLTAGGIISSYRSNIIWGDDPASSFYKISDVGFSGTPTTDYGNPTNIDYNGGFNFTAACTTGCGAYTNQGRGYTGKWSATPGAHDVTADPLFVDYQRTAELYPSKGLGLTRAAWSSGATYAIGDFVSVTQSTVYWNLPVNFRYTNDAYEGVACSSANPKPGSGTNWRSCWEWEILFDLRTGVASGSTIIADMMTWVRAGWTPTNAAYRVTFPGDTNAVTNLGAVQMGSGAGQSVVIPSAFTPAAITTSATIGTFQITSRLHGQNWNATTGSNTDVWNLGGFGITYLGGSGSPNAIQFKTGDNGGNTVFCAITFTGVNPADVLVRLTRDIGSLMSTGEAWNTITGLPLGTTCTDAITTVASSASIKAQASDLGSPAAGVLGGDIAFIRWYSGMPMAIGSVPFVTVASPADLADYEFENNLNDTSGNTGQNFSGTVTYAATPTYAPSCSAGVQQAVRTGTTMNLDGSNSRPLDGGLTLTYSWSYFAGSDGVNQSPTITSGTTVTPSVTGLNLFGSADFHLTVTDASSAATSCDIHNGVVVAATNGVIDLTSEGIPSTSQIIIGPLIKYGQNRWPWADTIHKVEGDLQAANLATYYTPYWETPMAGTISVTAGSAVATGSGTSLLAPCNGGSSPVGQIPTFIIIYPGTDGRTHYLAAATVACTDATHLTFSMPGGAGAYPTGTPSGVLPNCTSACTGWHWQWGYAPQGSDPIVNPQQQYQNWAYGPAPGNYYDNVKTFYGLYWRSGIDTYLIAGRNLADWWWEFPVMDQGYACNPAGSTCWAPAAWRSMAMAGIYLRALEEGGSSPKWPGIWIVDQLAQAYMVNTSHITTPVSVDGRETGYAMSILGYCALTDPNGTHRSTCKGNIQTNLSTVWTAFRRTDIGSPASWPGFQTAANSNNADLHLAAITNAQASSITALSGQGSACVINGSTTVTGVGTVWDGNLRNFSVWFFTGTGAANAPVDNTVGDPVGNGVVSINAGAQTLTLLAPYAGTTGCTGTSGTNKGYLFGYFQGDGNVTTASNGFMGWGILPYSQGLLGTAFGWAAKAMDDGGFDPASAITYRQYLHETVQWLRANSLNTISGGLYSGSQFVGCIPPIALTNIGCQSADQSGTRSLSLDIMRDLSMDYLQNGSPSATLSTADLLMSQMFSKPDTGGPNPDGFYITGFNPTGTYVTGTPPGGSAPKWAGQLCGYEEACDMWPAARLLGGSGGSFNGGPIRSKGIVTK